jgi:hypothetical protein
VANFNAIRSTRGVGSFVLNHAVIVNGIIEEIKKSIAGNKQGKSLVELLAYCQSDTVELTQGSLLMVKMLGQQRQVVEKNQDFEKVVNKYNSQLIVIS